MASSSDTPHRPGAREDETDAAQDPATSDAVASETVPQDAPSRRRDTPSDDGIEDAEVISERPAAAETAPEPQEAAAADGADTEASRLGQDADAETDAQADTEADTATPPADDAAPGAQTAEPERPAPARQQPAPPQRGGMMPLVLGGAVAAALGAGALWYLDSSGTLRLSGAGVEAVQADLAAQSDRLDGLAGSVETLSAALAVQSDRIAAAEAAAQEAAPAGAVAALGDRLGDIDARLEALQALPIAQDPEAMGILQSYRSEVAGLREEVAALVARGDALIAAAETATARADAAEGQLGDIAAQAQAAETRARARAALRLVETALASGGPFAAALDEIAAAGVTPPETLAPLAAEGVPTLAELRTGFPVPAREALEIALRDVQDRPLADRMTAFLRLQFGMRSLTPRDGADADAVLSRSEAALAAGELDAALAELDALPEAARAPLADWVETVRTRRAAEAGLAALTAEVEAL
jgi:hypothetical protein